ncbi:hypothetical protein O4H26_05270 [Aequorivita viscosa]|nr:hypothetical protein [Aequorivita viscosa]
MKCSKKLKQILTRIQIISGTIWAMLLIICYQVLGESFKEISLILIAGYFIEFLFIGLSKGKLNKSESDKL